MPTDPRSAVIWRVIVDDNFHFMDESESYELGQFDSYEAAVAACKHVVDRFLAGREEATADELFRMFIDFGESPFVRGPQPETRFNSVEYARQLCHLLRPTK